LVKAYSSQIRPEISLIGQAGTKYVSELSMAVPQRDEGIGLFPISHVMSCHVRSARYLLCFLLCSRITLFCFLCPQALPVTTCVPTGSAHRRWTVTCSGRSMMHGRRTNTLCPLCLCALLGSPQENLIMNYQRRCHRRGLWS
jgi:hypothetical protein